IRLDAAQAVQLRSEPGSQPPPEACGGHFLAPPPDHDVAPVFERSRLRQGFRVEAPDGRALSGHRDIAEAQLFVLENEVRLWHQNPPAGDPIDRLAMAELNPP